MAKKRQSIHAIQAALLSNTRYIGDPGAEDPAAEGESPVTPPDSEREAPRTEAPEEAAPPAPDRVELDPEHYRQLRALAAYQETTVEALVALAVGDLLALRGRQLRAALQAEQEAEPARNQ